MERIIIVSTYFRKAYGFIFYMFNLFIYLLFIASLTGVVACMDPSVKWQDDQVEILNGTHFSTSALKNKTGILRVFDFENMVSEFKH